MRGSLFFGMRSFEGSPHTRCRCEVFLQLPIGNRLPFEFLARNRMYQFHYDAVNRWLVSLTKSGVIPTDLSHVAQPLELLSKNPERVAILKGIIRQARWRAISSDVLIEIADKLILSIDEELSRI